MYYAPVVIPTLNRYDHLQRCIDSLKKNECAKDTDLYISLDYPPAEKYISGYKKVESYLDKGIYGFHKVHIYKQTENLGPYDNLKFVIREALKEFDYFILTEDDNEFSQNFLAFMDKGLERFEKDEKVMNICGYCHPGYEWDAGSDNAFRMIMAGWGSAFWKEKYRKMEQEINIDFFYETAQSFSKMIKLYKESRSQFCYCVNGILTGHYPALFAKNGEITLIDVPISIYYIIKEKYSVLPTVSKVRNWGNDGSGVNCQGDEKDNPMDYPLDTETDFEYIICDKDGVADKNLAISSMINAPSVVFRMATIVRYIWWYITKGHKRIKAE